MRLPRVRFTVPRMMFAVAAVAAAVAAWMESRQDPSWRWNLNVEMKWSQSPVGEFFPTDDVETYQPNGLLLKVSDVDAPQGGPKFPSYRKVRWCLSQAGELSRRDIVKGAYCAYRRCSEGYLTRAELAEVQQTISKLPPSNGPYRRGALLLVSTLSDGSWVTKVYDKAALPPAVRDLVTLVHLKDSSTRATYQPPARSRAGGGPTASSRSPAGT